MTETYQDWVDRMAGGRSAKPLTEGEVVKSSSGEPFGAVEFVKIPKKGFMAEVGKKGNLYIYHFFMPAQTDEIARRMASRFYDVMAQVFLDIFKNENQVEADWVNEMRAWAVRVRGWTDHVWGDELALRVVDRIDQVLQEGHD